MIGLPRRRRRHVVAEIPDALRRPDRRRIVIRIEASEYARLKAVAEWMIVSARFDALRLGQAEVTMQVDATTDAIADRVLRRVCVGAGVTVLASRPERER